MSSATEEFGNAKLGDKHLNDRLVKLAETLSRQAVVHSRLRKS
jgi:hypothetical protein